jgi:hypothetical protein
MNKILIPLSYLGDRLKEPGSIRSLVLLLFLVRGKTVDDATIQFWVDFILAGIAAVSFLMKEPSSKVLEAVAAVAPTLPSQVALTLPTAQQIQEQMQARVVEAVQTATEPLVQEAVSTVMTRLAPLGTPYPNPNQSG